MGWLSKNKGPSDTATQVEQAPVSVPATSPAQPAGGGLLTTKRVSKGESTLLVRKPQSGNAFTLITTWDQKDYDLYALVEYYDGHVEVVSCFGTIRRPHSYSPRTQDGAVVHVSGDQTAYGAGRNLPQEVITIHMNPNIRCVVPVVYSAKNSGVGSFYRYRVSTYVMSGTHQVVPATPDVAVDAANASRDERVYTFVPAVIHNGPQGATIEAVELYSRRGSELRPTVRRGVVAMDSGEENSSK